MAKEEEEGGQDWLPAAQGVGPPDPAVTLAKSREVQQPKSAEDAPENAAHCGQRTAENWSLGSNI